jgi:hypothetical protein
MNRLNVIRHSLENLWACSELTDMEIKVMAEAIDSDIKKAERREKQLESRSQSYFTQHG